MSLQEMNQPSANQEDHWIPLSDLMTGLMLIFMLVAIVFMLQVQRDAKKAKAQADEGKKVVNIYKNMRAELFNDLYTEFEQDLPKWKARLDRDLSLRFDTERTDAPDADRALRSCSQDHCGAGDLS